jgi:hypothetical protein
MEHMFGEGPPRRMARRLRTALKYIGTGLMYIGAAAWPTPEVWAALKAAKSIGRPPRPPSHPDRVTAHEDLPPLERRIFLDLEAQFRRQNEK